MIYYIDERRRHKSYACKKQIMFKKFIVTLLISMVPIAELRVAVPFGLSPAMDGPLPVVPLYIVCIIGNMIPVPFIFFLARKVLIWGADKKFIGKIFKFFLEKGEKGGRKLQDKARSFKHISPKFGENLIYIALFLFVGIPVPGTGAWTGTLAASFLDLDFKKSCIAIILGVLCAGIIMGILAALGFGAAATAMNGN